MKVPLPNNSVTTAAITDANVTTAKLANTAVTGAKIDFPSFNNRQNNTTPATGTPLREEFGWRGAIGNGTGTLVLAVTFTTAFTSLPIVEATFGGDVASATISYGSAGANIHSAWVMATNITLTGFNIILKADTGTWNTNHSVYAQWHAKGN